MSELIATSILFSTIAGLGAFSIFFLWAFIRIAKRLEVVKKHLVASQEMMKLLAEELLVAGAEVKQVQTAMQILERALFQKGGGDNSIEFIPDFDIPDDDDKNGGGTSH